MSETVDAGAVIDALGGVPNIESVEACITRLRITVADPGRVDGDALRAAGATAVIAVAQTVQVVVGHEADALTAEVAARL
ncbi:MULTISPECIES: glucose PTS transporter subunit EIIB [Actinomyces]|uniref:PTS transporter subunit EIIB n=1 Tax=Actinomyces respiraculi TaxID=2744574 RepID=A0A7T0LLZ2_9ACTO|nr:MULTISPECIES: PTS transporter subunit EIIB [Actinomyces]QPL06150.1 PTS transporter subunit EIIB [Actinomyces respiraculi]